MKRILTFVLLVAAISLLPSLLQAQCTTIQDSTLLYQPGHFLSGQPLRPGYDVFGYNYQAHLFNGSYANAYLGRDNFGPYEGDDASYLLLYPGAAGTWYWPYRTVTLNMKWNDPWLSNKDCNHDGLLDRHYGYASYIGSGAWLTNHQSENVDDIHWSDFVKIVAVPANSTLTSGIWYTSSNSEIGPDIWGEMAIIQEVYNDPAAGAHGVLSKSPTNPGFGYWGNQ